MASSENAVKPVFLKRKMLTWFITGTSSGPGEVFPRQLLARGDKVIATAHSLSKIQHFQSLVASILELDITLPQCVLNTRVEEAISIYEGVDEILNNAEYVGMGTLEDVEYEQWVDQVNTNIFKALDMARAIFAAF